MAAGVQCGGKCKALYDAAGHHAQTRACVCHSRSAYPARHSAAVLRYAPSRRVTTRSLMREPGQ
eukprot:2161095-Rhodomonas_salina.3